MALFTWPRSNDWAGEGEAAAARGLSCQTWQTTRGVILGNFTHPATLILEIGPAEMILIPYCFLARCDEGRIGEVDEKWMRSGIEVEGGMRSGEVGSGCEHLTSLLFVEAG